LGEEWSAINNDTLEQENLNHHDPEPPSPPGWILAIGYLLFFTMGISPQLLQNGLFLETAVFKNDVPEGRAISAAIITAFMVANILVLVYLLLQSFRPVDDKIFVWLIFAISVVDCVFVAFFWQQTTHLFGYDWSYALLLLSFVAGAAGNTSTLVFFAFASNYHPLLTTALSAGYGASSVLAAGIALLQRPISGFTTRIYFFVLLAGIAIGFLAYVIVMYHRLGKALKSSHQEVDEEGYQNTMWDVDSGVTMAEKQPKATSWQLFKESFIPLFHMVWVSIITFFVPGLITYMTSDQYRLTFLNGIFLVAPPLGAFLSGVLPCERPGIVNVIQTVLAIYMFLPLLEVTDDRIPTSIWALYVLMAIVALLSGYNTTMLYLLFRKYTDVRDLEKISRWAAMANQLGATIGVVLNDILIIFSLLARRDY
jgi:MFS family permease